MNTLGQIIEICTKLHVDPAKIKIGGDESRKIEYQIKETAIKLLLSKKEPAQKPAVSSKSQPS